MTTYSQTFITKEAATGTCLADTFWFAQRNPKKYMIIHTMVERHSDGLRHPHAVIYDTEEKCMIEVSNQYKNKPVKLPFMDYIKWWNCTKVKQYTFTELRDIIMSNSPPSWKFFHLLKECKILDEMGL